MRVGPAEGTCNRKYEGKLGKFDVNVMLLAEQYKCNAKKDVRFVDQSLKTSCAIFQT